jgi:hypothetical protein
MFENMLQAPGIKILLEQIVKSAAPQLVETIEGFTSVVREFNMRMQRVEENQQKILQLVEQQNDIRRQPALPEPAPRNGKHEN